MFTKMYFWVVLMVVLGIGACEPRDQIPSPVQPQPVVSESPTEKGGDALDGSRLGVGKEIAFVEKDHEGPTLKAGICIDIWGASSVNTIPTYNFAPYFNYKWSYSHVTQPDGSSCSWTSYVMCVAAISNACGKPYPATVDQVWKVKNGCSGSSLVTTLRDYANITDKNFVSCSVSAVNKSATNAKFSIIKTMLLRLYVDKAPFVAIARTGSIAHYVLVYAINWKQGCIGSTIYYIDPLTKDAGSFDANVSSMDFGNFLYLMETNSNTNYNTLMFWPR